MDVASFYREIIDGVAQPPDARHERYVDVHTALLDRYLDILETITPEQAAQPVNQGEDRRTLAQLIGHIAEWDRFSIQAASDILIGLNHPRTVTSVEGYVEPDGRVLNFAGVDDFNRYQAEKQADWSWERIRDLACDSAQMLHTLFTDEWLLHAERLERTLPWKKKLRNGIVLEPLTMGWTLWIIELEHLGAEHVTELHFYDES